MILLAVVACAMAAIPPTTLNKVTLSAEDKAYLVQQLEDEELAKTVEEIVEGLDDEQLEKLETILAKDLDKSSEFDMLMAELKELGMEEDDIEDLVDLSEMMYKFLARVPGVEEKVTGESEYTLLDQIKLYLLGLPNDIGPLGFVALHSALQGQDGDDDDIVDVKLGEFVPDSSVAPVGDVIQRKKQAAEKAAAEKAAAKKKAAAEEDETAEIVKEILRRRRSANE